MGSYSVAHGASVVVATAATTSAAELIKATLAANGFQATLSPGVTAYPSVDFVQGVTVSVAPDVADEVRELLAKLSTDPAPDA